MKAYLLCLLCGVLQSVLIQGPLESNYNEIGYVVSDVYLACTSRVFVSVGGLVFREDSHEIVNFVTYQQQELVGLQTVYFIIFVQT